MRLMWNNYIGSAGDVKHKSDNSSKLKMFSENLTEHNCDEASNIYYDENTKGDEGSVIVLLDNTPSCGDLTEYLNSRCGTDRPDMSSHLENFIIEYAEGVVLCAANRAVIISECSSFDTTLETDPFEKLLAENEALANEVVAKTASIEILKDQVNNIRTEFYQCQEMNAKCRAEKESLKMDVDTLRTELMSLSCRLLETTDSLEHTKRTMVNVYHQAYDETKVLADRARRKIKCLGKKLRKKTNENVEMKCKIDHQTEIQSKLLPQLIDENTELNRALDEEYQRQTSQELELRRTNEKMRLQEKENERLKQNLLKLEHEMNLRKLAGNSISLSNSTENLHKPGVKVQVIEKAIYPSGCLKRTMGQLRQPQNK